MKKVIKLSLCLLALPIIGSAQWIRNTATTFPTTHLNTTAASDNVVIGATSSANNAKLEVVNGDVIFNSINGGKTQFINPNGDEGLSILSPTPGILGDNRADIRFDGLELLIGCHAKPNPGPVGPVGAVPVSNAMIINKDGRVGFGVSPSTAKLEIKDYFPGSSGLRFIQLNSTYSATLNNGKALTLDATGNVVLSDVVNTATASNWTLNGLDIYNNNAGNTGIGTTNPSAKLELNSGTTNTSGMKFSQLNSSSPTTTNNNKALTVDASGNVVLSDVVNTATVNNWILSGLDIYNNNAGNTGIGTTTPSAKLELNSGATNTSGLKFTQLNSSSPTTNNNKALTVDASGNVMLTDVVNASSSSNWTKSGTKIYNNNIGNVGIGTNNPTAKLELNSGTTNASGLKISTLSAATTPTSTNLTNGKALAVDDNGNVVLTDVHWKKNGANIYNTGTTATKVGVGTTAPFAQLDVESKDESITLSCRNTTATTGHVDNVAVNAVSLNDDGYGIGGHFSAGYKGIDVLVMPDMDQYSGSSARNEIYGAYIHTLSQGATNTTWGVGLRANGLSQSMNGSAIGVWGHANAPNPNNAWAIYAQGRTYESSGTGTWTSSDARLKKNIENIESGLELINQLQPKTYEYKDDGKFATANFAKGRVYGFLAQDLEKTIPEMVTTAPIMFNGNDDDKTNDYSETYKAVSYQMLIPVLTQAIKEQQQEIVTLRDELMQIKEAITKLTNTTNISNPVLEKNNSLSQNVPNPFSVSTEIPFHLTETVSSAYVYVCDLNGKLIKKYEIDSNVKDGSINISAENLADGMYIYTLVANSKIVDSKRMLVTK